MAFPLISFVFFVFLFFSFFVFCVFGHNFFWLEGIYHKVYL